LDIQLIAVDLDGTALNSKKEISPRTMAAIKNALKAGKFVIPATGRSLGSMPKELLEIQGLSYLILNNGSVVALMPGNNFIFSHVFRSEISLSLFEQFRTYPCMILAAKPECSMLDHGIFGVKDEKMQNRFMVIKKAWNPLIVDIGKAIHEDPFWVNFFSLIFTDESEWQRVFSFLKKQEGLNVTSSTWCCIDIMPAGIHKGMALCFIAEKLGLEMSQVMAIGDNLNDMEMLQHSGCGVAMGNSVEALKELADRVTLSCDEDGVALAIEAIL